MYQVVLVDDEPYILEGLKSAIDWEGYGFEIAATLTDPLKALEYLKANQVHLLLTDVSMPEMDGMELIRQAKAENPLLSVLVLSAFDKFEYVRSALRCGAENYLLKPLDPDELAESVGQIVCHMQERRELSETYGLNMLTFRSSFIENWVKGNLSGEELRSRAELLGINLDAGNYTVVIFSSIDGNQESMSRFFDSLLSLIPGQYIGNFYFETPLRLVCILSALDPKVNQLQFFLLKLLQSAVKLRSPVFLTVGGTTKSSAGVVASYQQAKTFLFMKYTDHTSFIYREPEPMQQKVMERMQQPFAKIDLTAYVGELKSIFHDNLLPGRAEFYMLHALSWFLQQLGKELEETIQKFPQVLDLLLHLPSAERPVLEIRSYTVSFAETCHALLMSLNQSMYPCVDAVIKAIHEFTDKEISLKTLATKLNVSPSYLGNIFRQQTGSYFNDYLTEARLQYAAELIKNTDMKMKDIVDKIGFSCQTYFNRTFKRYYNTSPVMYRREAKAKQI